jgi:hypothetical protein
MSADSRRVILCAVAIGVAACSAVACREYPRTALEHLLQARGLTAELLVQLTKAADASNRAVMADTDEASIAFAKEADLSADTAQKDADALAPLLRDLDAAPELKLLEEFRSRFARYRELDRRILELAVLNTNLKAQRIAIGPAAQAADAFRDALNALAPATPAEAWHVKALAARAVADVREIQMLEAPHIAEADDAAMTTLEKRMADLNATARGAIAALTPIVQAASRVSLATATAALDRFAALHAQLIDLSRQNSNVRSQALALGQKRTLTAACEETLLALQDALAQRDLGATR